jgi:hypothetical protein
MVEIIAGGVFFGIMILLVFGKMLSHSNRVSPYPR